MRRRRPKAQRSKRAMNPLVTLRAVTLPDKRKKAAREACRGKVRDDE